MVPEQRGQEAQFLPKMVPYLGPSGHLGCLCQAAGLKVDNQELCPHGAASPSSPWWMLLRGQCRRGWAGEAWPRHILSATGSEMEAETKERTGPGEGNICVKHKSPRMESWDEGSQKQEPPNQTDLRGPKQLAPQCLHFKGNPHMASCDRWMSSIQHAGVCLPDLPLILKWCQAPT